MKVFRLCFVYAVFRRLWQTVLLSVVFSIGVSFYASPVYAEVIEEIYYVVGKDVVTKIDFDLAMEDMRLLPEESLNSLDGKALTNSVVSNLVLQSLLEQETEKLGISINEEEVKNQLQRVMRDNRLETEEQLAKALSQQGVTLEKLKSQIKRTLLFQSYIREELQLIPPSRKQIEEYYAKNLELFKIKEPVFLLHALRLPIPSNATFVQLRGLQQKMELVYKQLGEETLDKGVLRKMANGTTGLEYAEIGWATKKSLILSQENWKEIESLSNGAVASVMKIDNAFVVFYVEEVRRSGNTPKQLAYKLVENKIAELARQEAIEKKVVQLFASTIVERKSELFSFNP